ncbi:MAG TPA: hypothetical protein VFS21_26360 [Roseiflexaceae bacterium]|nr:hypothetical protein [Roseiflexaceae bacterium]
MDMLLMLGLVLFAALVVCWLFLPASAIAEANTKSEGELLAMPSSAQPQA